MPTGMAPLNVLLPASTTEPSLRTRANRPLSTSIWLTAGALGPGSGRLKPSSLPSFSRAPNPLYCVHQTSAAVGGPSAPFVVVGGVKWFAIEVSGEGNRGACL